MRAKPRETRKQRITRYNKLSKRDLLFLLLGSQDAFDELLAAISKGKTFSIIRPK